MNPLVRRTRDHRGVVTACWSRVGTSPGETDAEAAYGGRLKTARRDFLDGHGDRGDPGYGTAVGPAE